MNRSCSRRCSPRAVLCWGRSASSCRCSCRRGWRGMGRGAARLPHSDWCPARRRRLACAFTGAVRTHRLSGPPRRAPGAPRAATPGARLQHPGIVGDPVRAPLQPGDPAMVRCRRNLRARAAGLRDRPAVADTRAIPPDLTVRPVRDPETSAWTRTTKSPLQSLVQCRMDFSTGAKASD